MEIKKIKFWWKGNNVDTCIFHWNVNIRLKSCVIQKMQNMKKKDLLAIITGNPLSNEKVNTLPENLLGILFEDKTSQHNNSSKNSFFPGRSHFSHISRQMLWRDIRIKIYKQSSILMVLVTSKGLYVHYKLPNSWTLTYSSSTSFEKFVIFAPWTCDICVLFPGRQSSVLGNVEEN